MGPYALGTQVTMFFTFLVDGVATNPTTVTFRVERPDGTVDTLVFGVDAAVTNPSVGRFECTYVPAAAGTYNYECAGTGAVVATSPTFSFEVLPSAIGAQPAIVQGPCEPWIDEQDVAECCSVAVGTDTSVLASSASAAVRLLFGLSGRIYTGSCTTTVRPCRTRECGCDWQMLSRGHVVWSGESWFCGEATLCGCGGLSRVRLRGYPVRSVSQVKIDGAVVDSDTYRLDERRYLTRVRDPDATGTVLLWPSCQNLDLPDTATGTWSVTYIWGLDPPVEAVLAASQLACEIYKQCSGDGDCQLPAGATRITRQGLTIERQALQYDREAKMWRTGLTLVDAFLNSANPEGLRRRPAIWSPSSRLAFARPIGGA